MLMLIIILFTVVRAEGESAKPSVTTLLTSGGKQISIDPSKLSQLPQYKMKDKEGKELTVRSLSGGKIE